MPVFEALHDFRRLVTRSSVQHGNRRAEVIAIAAQKGGVGKTTTAVHLAAGLAQFQHKRVLLMDMDAQGHVETSILQHVGPHNQESLGQILLGKRRDIYEIATATQLDGLWYIPSDRELNHIEAQMASRIGRELLLKRAVRIARTHFDVIIIDCPPNLGSLTINALVAADSILVPCDLSVLSLDGVQNIYDTVETIRDTLNPDLRLLGLLRTRVDRRNQKVNGAIEHTLTEAYGPWVLDTDIGICTAISKAQLAGQTVFTYDPRCRAAAHYEELAAEVVRRFAH
ncbi:MAG: ParA family protein [Myxococcota bacterium]